MAHHGPSWHIMDRSLEAGQRGGDGGAIKLKVEWDATVVPVIHVSLKKRIAPSRDPA